VRRWLALGLATCGVTAAIAVPLLTGDSKARPPATFGGGSASFYPVGSPAYRRFCGSHKSFCATAQQDGWYMYSRATAVLVKTCYRGKCKTIDSPGFRHFCKAYPATPPCQSHTH